MYQDADMKARFDKDFFGLQLDWEDDEEIEYLGPSVLTGAARCTAATCKRGSRTLSYLYPVKITKPSQGRIVISYENNPSDWSPSWGWQVCKGDLIIDLREAGSLAPRQVSFLYRETGEMLPLEEGTDWVYRESIPTDHFLKEPRERLKVSRIARPKQQHLRNLLLSEYGQCQLTGTQCPEALEACHIVPVANGGEDTVANALLLRRDIHALFDAGLMRIRSAGSHWIIEMDASLSDPDYIKLHAAKLLTIPTSTGRFLEMRQHLE